MPTTKGSHLCRNLEAQGGNQTDESLRRRRDQPLKRKAEFNKKKCVVIRVYNADGNGLVY